MAKNSVRVRGKFLLGLLLCLGIFVSSGFWTATAAQEGQPNFHVVISLVQLNIAVTDNKGNYIKGIRPEDFVLTEDGISEKIASFAEGNEPTRRLLPGQAEQESTQGVPLATGSNVFVLFDTSNYMYRGFVFAQDAIAEFVRSLDTSDKVAFYSYSRNLSRASSLTGDRSQVLRGVRATVAGDDAALYNALLLTIKDASQYPGKRVVVVFSNGPDNASMVPPEDVAELAQSTGTAIYMISTQEARLEPVSTAVFERMSTATGGKAYFAKNWRDQKKAFASIREDLGHLYSLTYYPQANPNRGWRTISVKLVGEHMKKYHVRTRNGYRPLPNRFSAESTSASAGDSTPEPMQGGGEHTLVH